MPQFLSQLQKRIAPGKYCQMVLPIIDACGARPTPGCWANPAATTIRRTVLMVEHNLSLVSSLQADCLSGGESGVQAVPCGKLLGVIGLSNDSTPCVFVAAIFFAGTLFIYRVVNSPFGKILRIIRDNEPRAISLGWARGSSSCRD